MGKIALLVASLALTATALPASAAPMAVPEKAGITASNVITVSGGCGPAFYRNHFGYCVPYTYPAAYAYPGWYGYPYYAVRHHDHRWHHRHHRHHGGHGH